MPLISGSHRLTLPPRVGVEGEFWLPSLTPSGLPSPLHRGVKDLIFHVPHVPPELMEKSACQTSASALGAGRGQG